MSNYNMPPGVSTNDIPGNEAPEHGIVTAAARMQELADRMNQLKNELAEVQKEYDDIRKGYLPDLMLSSDIRNITLASIGRRVYLSPDVYAHITDKEAGYRWLRDNGYGDLIVPYVHPSTFKAFAKERIVQGGELPKDYFSVTPYMMAKLQKA